MSNDNLRRERRDFFFSYNMIFDQPISTHAKLAYLYLCRCADDGGSSFPSRQTIAKKCGVGVRTADKAIQELLDIGLLSKLQRFNGQKQTSNTYTIYNNPSKQADSSGFDRAGDAPLGVQEMHPRGAGDAPLGVQEMHPRGAGDAPEVLPNEVLPSEVLPSECVCGEATQGGFAASTPAKKAQKKVPSRKATLPKVDSFSKGTNKIHALSIPPTSGEPQVVRDRSTYGEFQKVSLADVDYNTLVAEYGEEKVKDYIQRLDQQIASTGKRYPSHMATIRKWIREDAAKVATASAVRQSRLTNFQQRENDYTQIEKRERELMMQRLSESDDGRSPAHRRASANA